jgi:hypothetical protein
MTYGKKRKSNCTFQEFLGGKGMFLCFYVFIFPEKSLWTRWTLPDAWNEMRYSMKMKIKVKALPAQAYLSQNTTHAQNSTNLDNHPR